MFLKILIFYSILLLKFCLLKKILNPVIIQNLCADVWGYFHKNQSVIIRCLWALVYYWTDYGQYFLFYWKTLCEILEAAEGNQYIVVI